MRKITLILLVASFFIPLIGSAQQAQTVQNAQGIQNLNPSALVPVQDLMNLLNKAKSYVPLLNVAQGRHTVQAPAPAAIPSIAAFDLSTLTNAWSSANAWSEANLGVSLTSIATTVMNFMMWIWGLVWKLLQFGLSHIQFT